MLLPVWVGVSFLALWNVEQLRLTVWKLKECPEDKTGRKRDISCRYPQLSVEIGNEESERERERATKRDGCNDTGITRQVYGHWAFWEHDTWDSGHLPEAGQSPQAIRIAFGPNRCPSAAGPEDRARWEGAQCTWLTHFCCLSPVLVKEPWVRDTVVPVLD